MAIAEAAGPRAMAIFGATGDLTKRERIHAGYTLAKSHVQPAGFLRRDGRRGRLTE